MLSTPISWSTKRLQKMLLRLLPVRDDVEIFLVQDSAVVLSTRINDFGRGAYCVFGSLMASTTALQQNIMVECSRLCVVIRSRDLFLYT